MNRYRAKLRRGRLRGFVLCLWAGLAGCRGVVEAQAPVALIAERRQQVLDLYNLPVIRAVLDMIAYAETRDLGVVSYQRQYGHPPRFISDLNRHPSMIICSYLGGKRVCSSASGRYQFIRTTWEIEVEELGLRDFSPLSQDLAAINQIVKAGAVDDLKRLDLKTFFAKTCKIWASLPGSPYGQPTRAFSELNNLFKKRYAFYKRRARYV